MPNPQTQFFTATDSEGGTLVFEVWPAMDAWRILAPPGDPRWRPLAADLPVIERYLGSEAPERF
jgi:hypothetical protein